MKMMDINGKQYVLKLTINALIKCEMLMGRAISEIGDTPSFSDMRNIFHVAFEAGGSKHDIDTTGDLMSDIIERDGMEAFSEILTELINHTLGKSKSDHSLKQVATK